MAQPNTTAPAPSTPLDVPGQSKTFTSKVLETGSSLMQSSGPLKSFTTHLCGFCHPAHDHATQMEGHFWVSNLNEEVSQCLVFDAPYALAILIFKIMSTANARLIGVEYVISSRLFAGLPAEERKLWHSHQFDVTSGSFMAPGLPNAAERPLLQKLVNTYGKQWNLWNVSRGDALPLGLPQLMMVATAPGEWNPRLFQERDKHLFAPRAEQLKDILPALNIEPVVQGADDGKRERLSLQLSSSHA